MKTTLLLFTLMISMFAIPNSFATSGSDATIEVYDSSAEDEALAKAYAEEEAKYKAEQVEMERQYQEQLAQEAAYAAEQVELDKLYKEQEEAYAKQQAEVEQAHQEQLTQEAADKAEQIEMEQKYQEQLEKDKKFQEEQAKMEQLYQEQNQAEMEKLYQEQQTQESTQKESQVEMEKLYQEQEGNEQYEPSQAYDQDTTSTMPKDGQYIDMGKDEASYYKEQAKGDSMQAAAEQLMQDCMSKGGDMQSCMQSVRGSFENGNTGESASTQNMSSGDSDIAEQMMNDCMDKGGDLKSCMESVSNSFEGGSMDGGGSMQQMNGMPSDEMEQLMNKCISEGGDMQSCINVVNKAFEEGEELGIGVRGPLSTDIKCDKEDETQQIEGELYVCEGGVLLGPLGGDGVFSVEDDLGIGVRGPLTKEISDEDKEYISSLGEDAIDSWNDNNREYRSIKSIGCDNLEIRLINDERYVCSNNEWLGPLGGDGVFSNGSDIDDKSGVIIGDNHFKDLSDDEVEQIKESAVSDWAKITSEISDMSEKELEELAALAVKGDAMQVLSGDGSPLKPELSGKDVKAKGDLEVNEEALQEAAEMIIAAREANDSGRERIWQHYEITVQEIEILYQRGFISAQNNFYGNQVHIEAESSYDRATQSKRLIADQMIIRARAVYRTYQGYASRQFWAGSGGENRRHSNRLEELADDHRNLLSSSYSESARQDINAEYVEQVTNEITRHENALRTLRFIHDSAVYRAQHTRDEFINLAEQMFEETTRGELATFNRAVRAIKQVFDDEVVRIRGFRNAQLSRAQSERDAALAALGQN